MSLKTWMQIYYPVPAQDVQTEAEALEHSKLKWSGLRADVLQAHDVPRDHGDYSWLTYDATACALCEVTARKAKMLGVADDCCYCLLYKQHGDTCFSAIGDKARSPYDAWLNDNDPEPMIALIDAAIAAAEEKPE